MTAKEYLMQYRDAVRRALRQWIILTSCGRCLKFVSPGHTGVPDRIILMPGGRVYFAETKAPGKHERALQEYVQRKLRELGFKTYASVDSAEKIDRIIEEITNESIKSF